MFNSIDKDIDGAISKEELFDAFKLFTNRGRSNSEIEEMIKLIDSNNSGKITYKGKCFIKLS